MKRKVVRHGSATLTVSLPSKWVKANNIKNGDEIEVYEKERSLLISTDKEPSKQKMEVTIKGPDDFARRYINIPYILGYDEVKVFFEDSAVITLIGSELQFLLGFEIIDQGKNSLTIKNIASGEEEEFDNVSRRFFFSILSMAKEGLEALENKEYDVLKNVADFEENNTRLFNFCQRILNKKGYKDQRMTSSIYSIISFLEQISDSYERICKYCYDKRPSPIQEIIKFYKKTNELFMLFNKLYQNSSMEIIKKFRAERFKLEADMTELLGKSRNEEDIILMHHLLEIVDKTNHASLFFTGSP